MSRPKRGPSSRLHFESGGEPASGQIVPKSRRRRPHENLHQGSDQDKPSDRLRLEDVPPPGENAVTPPTAGADSGISGTSGQVVPKSGSRPKREVRRLHQSKLRTEQTGSNLDAARERLAKQKPYKRPGAFKSIRQAAGFGVWVKVHGKLHEAGRDNVGVEAAHRTELVGETAGRATTRFVKRRIRNRPTRQAAKWERRNIRAGADHRFRQMAHEHPELKKNALSRYLHKKSIQRKYRKKAYQEAQRAAKSAKKTAVTTEKIAAGVVRFVRRHPAGIVIALLCFLLIVLLQSCIGGALSIGSGLGGGIITSTSYLAEDADIDEAELRYSEWETDLLLQALNAETARPSYDEYSFNIGDVSHNPFELMAFLTAVYDEFTFDDVEDTLREIFEEQYTLTFTPIIETLTDTKVVDVGDEVGQVRTTGYCDCRTCNGVWTGGPTASGAMPTVNHTIAVDAKNPIVQMGTKVVINGVSYTVEDTGNLNANNSDIDIFFNTHAEALDWGRRTHTMYLAEGNSNAVEVTTTQTIRILGVNLTAQSFTNILFSRMDAEQIERFHLLMATKGCRQYLSGPFGAMNWLPYVTSYFGYRIHPISGEKDNHLGIDIGLPAGTEILAGQAGMVSFAGDSGGYGLVVVLDDGAGLVSKYAHCSEILVSGGQDVKAGDVIAKVGSTGSSTRPHLHFEIIKDNRYINPIFFALTNDYGQGPIYGTPGPAMGDGSYQALIAEAERHLSKKYVFGSNGPDTFDCSSFVCHVYTRAGCYCAR